MDINTKKPFGAIAISCIVIVSFSIGISAGKKMAAKPVPVGHVESLGYAARMVDKPFVIELSEAFHPTMESKAKRVAQFNADDFAKDKDTRWELVELFYRRVKK